MISGNLSSEIENNDMMYDACLAVSSLGSECLEVGRMRGFSFSMQKLCVCKSE